MEFFVAVIVVLVGLNIFFLLIFRGITARLGKFAQMNVLRQAGVFDELIRKKQEQLQSIQADIAAAKATQIEQINATTIAHEQAPDFLEIRQGAYTNDSFASEYRIIRDAFQVDATACVRQSLEQISVGNALDNKADYARVAQGILADITLDSAYELSTLSSEAQLKILAEMLSPVQMELVREYLGSAPKISGTEQFQSYKFLFWLKDYVFAHGDQVVVFTGSTTEDFNKLDRRIVTQHDDSICEGIYLLSKGKKFDYSIRNREIVG